MHALRTWHAAISNTIVTKQIEVLNFDIIERERERSLTLRHNATKMRTQKHNFKVGSKKHELA
jgi:hypothetical protein